MHSCRMPTSCLHSYHLTLRKLMPYWCEHLLCWHEFPCHSSLTSIVQCWFWCVQTMFDFWRNKTRTSATHMHQMSSMPNHGTSPNQWLCPSHIFTSVLWRTISLENETKPCLKANLSNSYTVDVGLSATDLVHSFAFTAFSYLSWYTKSKIALHTVSGTPQVVLLCLYTPVTCVFNYE